MLGTTIVAASLATGDTMSHTIRSSAIEALGEADGEVVSAEGDEGTQATQLGAAAGRTYFPASVAGRVRASLDGAGLADGVAPAIVEAVAARAPAQRRNEPRVTLFGADPAAMSGFGEIRAVSGGDRHPLGPRTGEEYVNTTAADEPGWERATGSSSSPEAGRRSVLVRDVVSYDGAGRPSRPC